MTVSAMGCGKQGQGQVNDADTKRAYESGDDAYRVFRKMLQKGRPPDDWDRLLSEARPESERLRQAGTNASAGRKRRG